MVNGVSNLKGTTNIQNIEFGSEAAFAPSLETKPDEVNFSGKNNTGKKLLVGAAVIAALVGFRGKIANIINKYFPNFFKTVGEKFTTMRKAIINFFKTHTPDKAQVTTVVNSAKENLTKGVNATKEGISKGVETVKDGISKTVTTAKEGLSNAKEGITKTFESAKEGIQEVSEKIKTKI
jgi:phage-related protein